MAELVHPEVEIHTARNVHRGREAAVDWAGKAYDHIVRRYVPIEIEPHEDGVRVGAALEYAWRATGEVGDSTEVLIDLGIRDGLISSWRLTELGAGSEAGNQG